MGTGGRIMTEYNFIKKGNITSKAINGTSSILPLEGKEFYITVETNDKDFFNFMDIEINRLLQKFERG